MNSNADLVYEGEITSYRISPTTATANNTAAQNRLTIRVNVRFYNKTKEEDDFEHDNIKSSASLWPAHDRQHLGNSSIDL